MGTMGLEAITAALVTRIIAVCAAAGLLLGGCASVRHFRPGQSEFDDGVRLFDQGRFEQAIPHFQRATSENPDFGEAYLYLGRSYLGVRRWREAIAPLRAAYRLAPAQTKDEIFNLILDAMFAASAGMTPADRPRSRDPLPDSP
jgi:tetratricopeptide (TPR) repeat protein